MKKIVLFILIISGFFAYNPTSALTINGGEDLSFPPIVGSGAFLTDSLDGISDEDYRNNALLDYYGWRDEYNGKPIFGFTNSNRYINANRYTSYYCETYVSGTSDCQTIRVKETIAIYANLKNTDGNLQVGNINLFQDKESQLKSIYIVQSGKKLYIKRYDRWSSTGYNWEKEILDFSNVENCGTDHPDNCLIVLDMYFYFSAKPNYRGIYIPLVNTYFYDGTSLDYSSVYLDAGYATEDNRSYWQKFIHWFDSYKGGYGKFLFDFTYDKAVIQTDGSGNMLVAHNGLIYTTTTDDKTFSDISNKNPLDFGYSPYYGRSGYFYYAGEFAQFGFGKGKIGSNFEEILMHQYLTGDDNFLRATMKNVINFTNKNYNVINIGASSTPNTVKLLYGTGEVIVTGSSTTTSGDVICGSYDIVCGIREGFKSISNNVSGFIESVTEILGKIYEFIKALVTFDLEKMNISFSNVNVHCSGNYEFSMTTETGNLDNNVLNRVLQMFSASIPTIPKSDEPFCTYFGMKTITYKKNSLIDVAIMMMLTVSFILFIIKTNEHSS